MYGKKWWEGTKRALKKNGHFYVPGKKNEALRELGSGLLVTARPVGVLVSTPSRSDRT